MADCSDRHYELLLLLQPRSGHLPAVVAVTRPSMNKTVDSVQRGSIRRRAAWSIDSTVNKVLIDRVNASRNIVIFITCTRAPDSRRLYRRRLSLPRTEQNKNRKK